MARGSKVKKNTRGRSCTGKRRFDTDREARDLLVKMRRQKTAGPLMGVYRCRFCEGFHLGHKRSNGRKG